MIQRMENNFNHFNQPPEVKSIFCPFIISHSKKFIAVSEVEWWIQSMQQLQGAKRWRVNSTPLEWTSSRKKESYICILSLFSSLEISSLNFFPIHFGSFCHRFEICWAQMNKKLLKEISFILIQQFSDEFWSEKNKNFSGKCFL